MATAVFGQMERFNSDNEGIQPYLERVELYFVANEVGEDMSSSLLERHWEQDIRFG